MPQFKECTVDELLRDSLIEFALKHNNRMMFELLIGEDWKDHVVKCEDKEKYNNENDNKNELHNETNYKMIYVDYNTIVSQIIQEEIFKWGQDEIE
jgi:hypothetical protein